MRHREKGSGNEIWIVMRFRMKGTRNEGNFKSWGSTT